MGSNVILTQPHLAQFSNLNGLGHNFVETDKYALEVDTACNIVLYGRLLQIRHRFLEMVEPVHFVALFIGKPAIQRTGISRGVVRTGVAIHVAH